MTSAKKRRINDKVPTWESPREGDVEGRPTMACAMMYALQ
jgi:hypothetical protein